MANQRSQGPVVTVMAFAFGVTLAWVPLQGGVIPLRTTSQYPVWVLLVALVCAACPAVWSRGMMNLKALPGRHRIGREAVAYAACAAVLALAVLLAPTALPGPRLPGPLLPHLGLRLLVLYLAVATAAGPGVIAVHRIGDASREGDGGLADLIAWRAILDSQLWSFGGLVVLATLTTSALRNAALSTPAADPATMPATSPLLFGACLSLVVGLAHYPSSSAWRERTQNFLDEAVALPKHLDGDWQAQFQRRHDLGNELGLDTTRPRSLQSWMIVGGPLITSALALLLPVA